MYPLTFMDGTEVTAKQTLVNVLKVQRQMIHSYTATCLRKYDMWKTKSRCDTFSRKTDELR